MDIGKLNGQTPHAAGSDSALRAKNKGSSGERPSSVGDGATPIARGEDFASISATGRETLAAVDSLAERARGEAGDRAEIVAAAQARLDSGALDGPEIDTAIAQRLLG